jgi:hypothetical protein
MRTLRRLSLPLLVSAGLAFGYSAAGVHASGAASKPHAAPGFKLVVTITDTGTLWGKVKASYASGGKTVTKTCAKPKCTWTIFASTTVKLTQTPTNSKTWPFKEWQVKKAGASTRAVTKGTLTVAVNGNYSVNALYVVA